MEGVASLVDDEPAAAGPRSAGGAPRYLMLETVREFGLERLAASGEEDAMRAAHAAHYLALAERAAPLVRGPAARAEMAALERDHGNLRAALIWFEHGGEAEALLRLAAALGYFWSVIGYWTEGNAWLERALAADLRPSPARLEALENLGENAGFQGDTAQAETTLREALDAGPSAGLGGESRQHPANPRGAAGGPGPLRGGRGPPRRGGGRVPTGGRPLR